MLDEKNLHVYLLDYTEKLSKRSDVYGLFPARVTVTITLVTSDFRDFIVGSELCRALFLVCDVILLWHLAGAALYAYKYRNVSPKTLLDEIKAEAVREELDDEKSTVTLSAV